MIDDGRDMCLVRLLAFWYSNQLHCVAWHSVTRIDLQLLMAQNRVMRCHHTCSRVMFVH